MNELPATFPSIVIYRSRDGRRYTFMELAEVDPGHYVGWGELRTMDCVEAARLGRDFVMASLHTFTRRDGNDRTHRLKFPGRELRGAHNDMITVRLLSTGRLEIIPHRWSGRHYDRLDDLSVTIEQDTPSNDFVLAVEQALAKVPEVKGG